MLAGEAKEILGGLSPATYLDALTLQNTAEIRAESAFAGTESDIRRNREKRTSGKKHARQVEHHGHSKDLT